MKRREFLIASAGVAGLFSRLGHTGSNPCPPGVISVVEGTSAQTSCEGQAPNSPPSWFMEMDDKTWTTPVTNTLDSVKPTSPLQNGTQESVCSAWTGGCVDQDRGEFILPANGGHTDYSGNEVYACALRNEHPAWLRLTAPSVPTGGTEGRNSAGNYADGNPRSSHTYNRPCWGDGNVWLAGLDSMYGGVGHESTATYSFNRTSLEWTYHGLGIANLSSDTKWLGGSAAYDRVDKKVWSVCQYGNTQGYFSVNADRASANFGDIIPYTGSFPWTYSWSVIAYDLRLWIVGFGGTGGLYTLDLNNPAAGFIRRSVSGSPSAIGVDEMGAVYHQPSRAILFWHGLGSTVGKLAIPANLGGTWSQSGIAPMGSNSVAPSSPPNNGTYSRFNLIEDMGNGQSALCLVNSTTGPTYVYKLPVRV